MDTRLHVLMIASENDGLIGGKVGGVGDVVRDLPPALALQNCRVSVITPSYGFLHKPPNTAVEIASVGFKFFGQQHSAAIYQVKGRQPTNGVNHFVIDHPLFSNFDVERGVYSIYFNDPPQRPFATDATKFALFCTAAAQAIKNGLFDHADCLHLHDWHSAFLLLLRKYDPAYSFLKGIRTVFSIHNLALQGVRPFEGDESSLASWYPGLKVDFSELADPRWPNCLNPMAIGIRLADAVHTVSPAYAEEILKPSAPPRYYGGEGLEADLLAAKSSCRLFGILNGCEYPPNPPPKLEFYKLIDFLMSVVLLWSSRQDSLGAAHFLAFERLSKLRALAAPPKILLTSVSRVTDQKMFLLKAPGSQASSGLQGILETLGSQGIYLLLGTGDKGHEQFLIENCSQFENFVFLNGFSDECANTLYASGDLFLMPSSFEPCGISQMMAMRAGQPCLVHSVGGLKDTVKDGENGFGFDGDSLEEQVDQMIHTCQAALELSENNPTRWQSICHNAAQARFLWQDTVAQYLQHLYK